MKTGGAEPRSYIHVMKIINIKHELVEVLWIDDNEVEYIPVSEFISRYGQAKINDYLTNKNLKP